MRHFNLRSFLFQLHLHVAPLIGCFVAVTGGEDATQMAAHFETHATLEPVATTLVTNQNIEPDGRKPSKRLTGAPKIFSRDDSYSFITERRKLTTTPSGQKPAQEMVTNVISQDLAQGSSHSDSFATAEAEGQNKALSIYYELLKIIQGPKEIEILGPSWIADVMQPLESLLAKLQGKSTIRIEGQDGVKIRVILKLNNAKINPQIVNKYYEMLCASDKSSLAMLRLDLQTKAMVDRLKNEQPFDYRILQQFFAEILTAKERLRRESVLTLQARQLEIVTGWEKQLGSTSKELGVDLETIRKAGELLQIGNFFPSFREVNVSETLDQIKTLRRENPQILRIVTHYLGMAEYRSRVKLLRTIQKFNLQEISSEQISAWLAQGLNVCRIIKILNYTKSNLQDGEITGPQFSCVEHPKEFERAAKLFLREFNDGSAWEESLDHDQTRKTSQHLNLPYIELRDHLKSLKERGEMKEPPPELAKLSLLQRWWRTARTFLVDIYRKVRNFILEKVLRCNS